jgi:hypothetical protein
MKPIEAARNLGPVLGEELRAAGIASCEELVAAGWEEAWLRICALWLDRTHMMCGYALYGAVENLDCLRLPPEAKEAVKRAKKRISAALRSGPGR